MTTDRPAPDDRPLAHATIAGGCFWCTEAVFEQVEGVAAVESGYIGGHLRDPSYERVCDGDTGHAEAVRVAFDPAVLPYRALLEIFFGTHDPTTRDRQGHDVGSQYRSAVFAHDAEQAATARDLIAELEAEGTFGAPIVTEVVEIEGAGPAGVWYPAEAYHQGYYRANPRQGYCAAVIAPKLGKFRQRFAHRLRGAA
jgi:peptide-methionine (S)-S-oxide reductase